jgi:hypothetical protein
LGIDLLIRDFRSKYSDWRYKYNGNDIHTRVIQAYRYDLLIFADEKEHLNTLIDATADFVKYEKFNFNSKNAHYSFATRRKM